MEVKSGVMSGLKFLIAALSSSLHTGILVVVAVAGLVLSPADQAALVASSATASWQMNEPPHAGVMHDSGRHGVDGSIGSAVATGVTHAGATAYRFSYAAPDQTPAEPDRLVMVNNAVLNPGTRSFAVTIRYRTHHVGGNMVQKGQAQTSGGYFKLEAPDQAGNMRCEFEGSLGTVSVSSGEALNDGRWHTVHCRRTRAGLTMTVDGVITDRQFGRTGNISNSLPLTIAGKPNCDTTSTCDYFAGDIDYVTIQAG
jgi:concanavalin A-like lectin/glucanase superfamily protein